MRTIAELVGNGQRAQALESMPHPPSNYLRRFHYDTITHSNEILLNLIRQVGVDRIVMGSDCPADMCYTQPVSVVERLKELSGDEVGAITGGNAARLLGML